MLIAAHLALNSEAKGEYSQFDDQLIPEECLRKTEPFGEPEKQDQQIDHMHLINSQIVKVFAHQHFAAYSICETQDNRMLSIQWTLTDDNLGNPVQLPRVGPVRADLPGSWCHSELTEYDAHIDLVRVFKDGNQIVGIGLKYSKAELGLIRAGYATKDY